MDEKTKTHNILSHHLQQRFLHLIGHRDDLDQKKPRSWVGLSEKAINSILLVTIIGVTPLAYLFVGLIAFPQVTQNIVTAVLYVSGGGALVYGLLHAYKALWVRRGVVALRRYQFRHHIGIATDTTTEDFQQWWKDVDKVLRGHRIGSLDFEEFWWEDLPYSTAAPLLGKSGRKVTPLVDPEGEVWLVDNEGTLMTTS